MKDMKKITRGYDGKLDAYYIGEQEERCDGGLAERSMKKDTDIARKLRARSSCSWDSKA